MNRHTCHAITGAASTMPPISERSIQNANPSPGRM